MLAVHAGHTLLAFAAAEVLRRTDRVRSSRLEPVTSQICVPVDLFARARVRVCGFSICLSV